MVNCADILGSAYEEEDQYSQTRSTTRDVTLNSSKLIAGKVWRYMPKLYWKPILATKDARND